MRCRRAFFGFVSPRSNEVFSSSLSVDSSTASVYSDHALHIVRAQRCGVTGVLVKTGKYLPETHRQASGTPDHVLDSFASLPGLLEHIARS